MSHRTFKPFSGYEKELLTCPECGWQGTFHQGDTDFDDWVRECRCPKHSSGKGPLLAVAGHPTLQDYRENQKLLPPTERVWAEEVLSSQVNFEEHKLVSTDQLPELPDSVLDLVWDLDGTSLIIRNGHKEIWREPARYECRWRFEEMVALLKKKYGTRLRDLVPTPASEVYLYGDRVGDVDAIALVRTNLEQEWANSQSSNELQKKR